MAKLLYFLRWDLIATSCRSVSFWRAWETPQRYLALPFHPVMGDHCYCFFFHGCDPLATRVYHEIKFSWVGLNVLREAPQNDRTSVSIRAASFPLIQPCTAHAACLDTPVFRAKSWLVVWMALIFLPSSNLTTHADGTYWKRTMIWTNQYARLSIACKVSEGV